MTKYLDNTGLTHFTEKMRKYADGKVGAVDKKVTSHIGNTQNPHGVTKEQVGLGKVTNDEQIPSSEKGTANGVATLDDNGKVPVAQMPTTMKINGQSIFGTGNLQLSASLYKIVDALPTTDIDTSKIYLVPASATTAKNNKTEYIYLGDPNKTYDESKWEKLGDEQKSTTVTTPGGSITVDTALIENSPNPVAGGVVKAKVDEIDTKLANKVESSTYTTEIGTINSTLEDLKKKETITVDAELKSDSTNPVQNKAVKKAVDDLDTKINNKANSTDLTAAVGRITTLENDGATGVIESGEGNGIASIKKVGKNIVATKGTFVTSLTGYVSANALDKKLADYVESTALASYYTKTEIDGKGYLTEHQSLVGYVNDVQPDGTSGNGIANITKEDKILKVTKATFLTEHQSLAGYVNDVRKSGTGNGIVDIVKNGESITVTKGTFVTNDNLNTAIKNYASQQGYLTKKDLQETVKITLVSTKSTSDAALKGATVTVKSGSSTIGTYTWQGSVISLTVAAGLEVTVSVSAVTGYKTPTEQTFTTIMSNIREVKMEYKEQKLGIYILETDGTMTDPTNWTKSDNSTVLGIYVGGENCVFVMATEGANKPWSTQLSTVVPGVKSEDGSESPTTDYDGIGNTKKFIDASPKDTTNSSAAYYCNNYKFKNGKNGYLFALGEALVVHKNFTKITQAYNAIGCNDTAVSLQEGYWTSNQDTRYRAWCGKIGTIDASPDGRSSENFVIPVCQY